ncbi:hypothetical protein A2635_03370 [Candidatus Peribacteria bacterium RIFCSPHIGHO2_01_FULL_51_9]|nr:MAG: hypothetical protein A2635_03370 [Candidatus Peribacteria bacterium RIFCSPHIGHO2_01_FULL_51_9]
MLARIRHILNLLDLEERILVVGTLTGLVGVFFPWISGQWLGGDRISYSGFGFFTAFIGTTIFTLDIFILLVTLSPLTGGPNILPRKMRDYVRFLAAVQAAILVIAALSVLTKVTFEFSRVEIRFGIYTALIGNVAASLYAFLTMKQKEKRGIEELFHVDPPEDQENPPSMYSTQPTEHPRKTLDKSLIPPPPLPDEHYSHQKHPAHVS